jgi:hypothetical protein
MGGYRNSLWRLSQQTYGRLSQQIGGGLPQQLDQSCTFPVADDGYDPRLFKAK